MNRQEKLTVLKNAAANVVRGGAAAMVAVALPPFLTRLMPADSYGAWSLVLQVSAYVGYLDFGVQTAVGRFVAYANEKRDTPHRDRIVSTALVTLGLAGIIGLAGSVILAMGLPIIFRQMPPILVGDARVALLLVAGSLAVGLPASVFNGVFVGLQRNEVPAVIIGGSRIFSAILLIIVVRHGGHLTQMGIAVAAVNLASYGLQYLAYRRMVPDGRSSVRLLSRKTSRELFDYCLGLSVWSLAMMLISGLDVSLVGFFQFDAVAYYAVATSLVTLIAGLQNAVFAVMISPTAVLHARGDSGSLGRTMITATRYGSFILLLGGLPLAFGARSLLSLWVGPAYALHGARILQVLVVANMIRLSATPYAMTLVGTGQQNLAMVTALLEGSVNLLASVVAGYAFGAVGVAIGTFIGALVGVGGNLVYNMRRTAGLDFRISEYIRDGLLRPAVCAVPMLLVVGLVYRNNVLSSTAALGIWVALAVIATALLVWHWGLVGAERQRLLTVCELRWL